MDPLPPADGWQVEVGEPGWLLLLLLVPLVVLIGVRSRGSLGAARCWTAISLRCLLVLLVALALADLRLRRDSDTLTVLFVWDRSQSVPEELERDADGHVRDVLE